MQNQPPYVNWQYQTPHQKLGVVYIGGGADTPVLYVGSSSATGQGDNETTSADALYALSLNDGDEQWQTTLRNPVQTSPIYGTQEDSARVYLATGPFDTHREGPRIHAFDPGTGEQHWQYNPETRGRLYPLGLTESEVVVGGRDDELDESGEHVFALGAETGEEMWRVESGDLRGDGHTVRRGTLIVSTHKSIQAIDPASGEERWRTGFEDPFDGPAFGNHGKRLFVGHDGTVEALSVADGSTQWRRDFGFTISRVTSPREAMSDTVFVGDYDGRLLAVSPLNGETRWTLSLDRDQFRPSVARTSETLYLAGAGIQAVDPVSGKRRWAFQPGVEGYLDMHLGTTVFASTRRENTVYALNPDTGERRWKFDPDRDIVSPVAAGTMTWVAAGGTVYALDGSDGGLRKIRITGSRRTENN
jgi:outer membrane protein assembly factor BamB